jgi:delta 1-pyrroline-5-carboxylate dehydrogenase
MNDLMDAIKHSLAVQESWQQHPIEQRAQILTTWGQRLVQRHSTFTQAAQMIEFQCRQALHFFANNHELPGPTGESNQLYCVGRGSFLVTGDQHANTIAMVGLMSAALVAGNPIICCVDTEAQCELTEILSELLKAGCPDRVAIEAPCNDSEALAAQPLLAGVALAGNESTCIHYNQILAKRDGRLAQLIYETDLLKFSHLSEASLCLRFMTERTRTINVTAIGGNATLLELGSAD